MTKGAYAMSLSSGIDGNYTDNGKLYTTRPHAYPSFQIKQQSKTVEAPY
jgi:hypothetical protein